jgi:hypothetical protein
MYRKLYMFSGVLSRARHNMSIDADLQQQEAASAASCGPVIFTLGV